MPLPNVRKRNPTKAQLIACFLVMLRSSPSVLAIKKISNPAVVNLIEAKKNGANSATQILLSKHTQILFDMTANGIQMQVRASNVWVPLTLENHYQIGTNVICDRLPDGNHSR